jgi:chemotaxis family two-component system response regulator Rcp1
MSTTALTRPFELLVVEDSDADAALLRVALQVVAVPTQLHVVTKGEDALAFLRREGAYTRAVRPDLIFLDLNLPGQHGLEVLADISADPDLRIIPSIILTTAQEAQAIQRSYALCVNCYIAKPLDLQRFLTIMRTLGEFWFTMVDLPGRG